MILNFSKIITDKEIGTENSFINRSIEDTLKVLDIPLEDKKIIYIKQLPLYTTEYIENPALNPADISNDYLQERILFNSFKNRNIIVYWGVEISNKYILNENIYNFSSKCNIKFPEELKNIQTTTNIPNYFTLISMDKQKIIFLNNFTNEILPFVYYKDEVERISTRNINEENTSFNNYSLVYAHNELWHFNLLNSEEIELVNINRSKNYIMEPMYIISKDEIKYYPAEKEEQNKFNFNNNLIDSLFFNNYNILLNKNSKYLFMIYLLSLKENKAFYSYLSDNDNRIVELFTKTDRDIKDFRYCYLFKNDIFPISNEIKNNLLEAFNEFDPINNINNAADFINEDKFIIYINNSSFMNRSWFDIFKYNSSVINSHINDVINAVLMEVILNNKLIYPYIFYKKFGENRLYRYSKWNINAIARNNISLLLRSYKLLENNL